MSQPPFPPSAAPSQPHAGFLPPAELPLPNAEEVARFQILFLARFGVELSEEDAQDQARRLVQFVFLMRHALPQFQAARAEEEPPGQTPS